MPYRSKVLPWYYVSAMKSSVPVICDAGVDLLVYESTVTSLVYFDFTLFRAEHGPFPSSYSVIRSLSSTLWASSMYVCCALIVSYWEFRGFRKTHSV
jgi:hypothetical protein